MRSRSNSNARLAVLTLASLVASSLAGCQVATVKDPLTAQYGSADPDVQMEFLHRLADRPLASNDEAAHVLLLFVGEDVATTSTYEQRVDRLKAKGLYAADFARPADEAVRRGTVAVALVKALNIRGGITMSIFGPTERYAVRELADLGLLPLSSPGQTFSGTELVGVISKAEDHQRGGGGEKTPQGLAGQQTAEEHNAGASTPTTRP